MATDELRALAEQYRRAQQTDSELAAMARDAAREFARAAGAQAEARAMAHFVADA